MATQASGVAGADASGVVEQLQRLIERFGLIAAGLVGIAGSAAALWKDSQPELRWGLIGVAAVALVSIFVGKVVIPVIQARRRQKVIAIPEASLRGPMTFRLRPYDEADHAAFDRPDRAHDAALRWLQRTSATFLYLTGFSGTGKSSLLQAWLIPELAKGNPPTRTVVARSYADPLAQLIEALTKPGLLWDRRAPATDDPYTLLERATEKARPARLLIAIDQFEECLILQDEAGREQLAALFRSIGERPIPGLTFLLVLRTDYLDVDQLRTLGLPEVRSDANWFNLKALSRGEARELLDQRLKLHEREREKVLDEASEVDDLPGLVRPITLNMLGLVLQRARGGVLAGTAPGRLIQNYLRIAMAQPGIDDLAPALLERMITDKGTKRPVDEPALVGATGAEPRLVRKALLLLAEEGVVRELEPERHVWEISHDFVARELGRRSWMATRSTSARRSARAPSSATMAGYAGSARPVQCRLRTIPSLLIWRRSLMSSTPARSLSSRLKTIKACRRCRPGTASAPSPSSRSPGTPACRRCRPGTASAPSPSSRSPATRACRRCRPGTASAPSPSSRWSRTRACRRCRPGTASAPSLTLSSPGVPLGETLTDLESGSFFAPGEFSGPQVLPAWDGLGALTHLTISWTRVQVLPAMGRPRRPHSPHDPPK